MGDNARDGASAADLFELLWETLADMLGTAAAATLLRRSIAVAEARTASPEPVVVTREGLDYTYRLPETWRTPGNDDAVDALRIIAAELRLILVELTGPVVIARLGHLAVFRKWGIDFGAEERHD